MKKNFTKTRLVCSLLVGATLFATSCKKSTEQNADLLNGTSSKGKTNVSAINNYISLDWENRTNGSTYTAAQATADFGNVIGWNDSRAYITNGKNANGLRATLLPNALSGAGGLISNIDVSDGSAYEMDYDVKFHSQFNWSRGGKVGFGFAVGDGNTGGDPGWDGNGGSLRLMWYSPDSNPNRVFFQPYVYHKDQPGEFGDTFDKKYPATGSLVKGQWYRIHLYIKSNTGSNKDGRVQILIDGNTVLDQSIRWTTNDVKRLIKEVTFHTFRGGSQDYWKTNTTDYIYYDNLMVRKIN